MKSKMHNIEARRYFQRTKEEHEKMMELILISVVGFYAPLMCLGVAGAALIEWWAQ